MSTEKSTEKKASARRYTTEYKAEAVKLVWEIGNKRAAAELGIPESTLSSWATAAKSGGIDTGLGTQQPGSAISLAAEIQQLKAENKAMAKANALLRKENAFLEEASAFFAASRQKLAKEKE